ncbi:MAG: HAMP domain-containing histidine kinase [Lachnospiraceae bacterium]|nr:HAMP domain-containing histidine kinase [Lachnospiraceae bacterium]
MRRSLLLKFLALYILVAALGLTFITTFSYQIVYSNRLKAFENSLYSTAGRLCSEYGNSFSASGLASGSAATVFSEIEKSMGCRVIAISKTGWVFYPAGTEDRIENFDPTKSDARHGFPGRNYEYFDPDDICVYAPVVNSYVTLGYFILSRPGSELNSEINQTLNVVYLTAGVIFALFLPVLLLLYLHVIRPISKLKKAAKEYAKGNLTYEYRYKSQDELGELSTALTFMASELSKTGEDQKKFITNVSHDFRSPLTSIRGYVDAMLDGTIPPSMQSKYLNVVKDETDRLTKLTQSLLDLNTISSNGTLLELTDFDIHHVIKKTLATFEGRCTDRGISFELLFASRELFVHADMSRIQQVIYNLTDNAIKFSGQGMTITIETSIKKGKAYISVKDQGVGISAENLTKIWERFYKTDSSRGRDKKGLGLGLSIVRDIVTAHGETIDVISTEGVGTEFIFTLPLSPSAEE